MASQINGYWRVIIHSYHMIVRVSLSRTSSPIYFIISIVTEYIKAGAEAVCKVRSMHAAPYTTSILLTITTP